MFCGSELSFNAGDMVANTFCIFGHGMKVDRGISIMAADVGLEHTDEGWIEPRLGCFPMRFI